MSIYLYLSKDKIFLVGIVGRMPNMPFSINEKGTHIFSARAKSAGSHGENMYAFFSDRKGHIRHSADNSDKEDFIL